MLALPLLAATAGARAEDGYELWLRYRPVSDPETLKGYRASITGLVIEGSSPTLRAAREEAARGLRGLLGADVPLVPAVARDGLLVAGTPSRSSVVAGADVGADLGRIGEEGFVIRSMRVGGKRATVIAANTDVGVLYGVFRFLRLLQTHQSVEGLSIVEAPRVRLRVLNHWDNLNRTVERGYAGFSLWDWHKLPDYIEPRYTDYARANASIGINGTVLTNVNANATSLLPEYLGKAAALAEVFRPYGIRVYLTARFSAPIEIGGLKTADPLDPEVAAWWKRKADEIYGYRAKQAYNEFTPLDGRFHPNVIVQVKNGPIDFQPREPFHPLFGAMPKTPLMMEVQITQECGSVFACANWYAFGRLAWDHELTSARIADEWLRTTFTNDAAFVRPATEMMLGSREAAVDYMTPLGLHHLMAEGHHYGPGPWVSEARRADWTSVYYHRADAKGIGFDRTASGSNAVGQYFPPVAEVFGRLEKVPEEHLLWFHHAGWDHRMASGLSLWEELVRHYYGGVEAVRRMRATWRSLEGRVDAERHEQVRAFLAIQEKEARWWRDACVLYFQTFSGRPIPDGYERPEHDLGHYMAITKRSVPGS